MKSVFSVVGCCFHSEREKTIKDTEHAGKWNSTCDELQGWSSVPFTMMVSCDKCLSLYRATDREAERSHMKTQSPSDTDNLQWVQGVLTDWFSIKLHSFTCLKIKEIFLKRDCEYLLLSLFDIFTGYNSIVNSHWPQRAEDQIWNYRITRRLVYF